MSKISGLYVVATPIGNLEDFSPRAINTLQNVNQIAAEDTRHSQKLLKHFGIVTSVISLHEHNEAVSSKLLLDCLKKNQSIALISDAGTPLINDPGYRLVKLAHQHGIPVIPIPGPCALITALCASGLTCDRFIFEGFLPGKSIARQKKLLEFLNETRTSIFYEAPHRILELIDDMLAVFGPKRYVVLARELTKTFETIHGDNLEQLKIWLNLDRNQQKGEFVVLVEGAEYLNPYEIDKQRILGILLDELPIKQATSIAAKITHEKKNKLYALALAITGK
ncbi:16S rRNA (cytidine(1402)-2'-O)-methyltransferase [Rickettsiella endosymbiont of Xylota segnis]|uniref:16S rRNA (cytidine(1402)-2'-O)-methyltransferase n=1 Tax=Rickettsiella endosymbiont of Xylota segnis TaxID=3066238 RepID=UPI0030D4795D